MSNPRNDVGDDWKQFYDYAHMECERILSGEYDREIRRKKVKRVAHMVFLPVLWVLGVA